MQKQAMQLTSKMRYCAGQFVPYLIDDLWLKNARHSNVLAKKLADGLRSKLGERVVFTRPVVTNQVFCIVPAEATAALRAAGHEFYDWSSPGEVRFVISWDNTTADVEEFLALI
jgi:threonine aldolase